MSKKNKKKGEAEIEPEIREEPVTSAIEEQAAAAEKAPEGESDAESAPALKERLQRLAAEYQNYRKQAEKRSVDARRFMKRDLVQQLLPIVDNFGHAMQALEQGQDAKNVLFGVKMIHEMLTKFLEENGILPIDSVGQDFDPSVHEAVSREETDEAAANTVLGEVQRGYRMGDLVVRHARVVVAAPKEAPGDEAQDMGEKAPEESD